MATYFVLCLADWPMVFPVCCLAFLVAVGRYSACAAVATLTSWQWDTTVIARLRISIVRMCEPLTPELDQCTFGGGDAMPSMPIA